MATAPVVQTLPFPVKVVRWFASPVMWVFIAGMVANVGTIVLSMVGTLGLNPTQELIALIAGNAILYAAGAYLKYQGTSVVGDSTDVANTGSAVTK